MKTADEILESKIFVRDGLVTIKTAIEAMNEYGKYLAGHSFESGWSRGYEYATLDKDENEGKLLNKEQFINKLFPE